MKRTLIAATLAAVATIGLVPTAATAQHRQERTVTQYDRHGQPTRVTHTTTHRIDHRDVQRAPNWRTHRPGTRFVAQQGRRWSLPAPGRAQTYIRRGNDLLLVNNRSHNVVRVYRGYFR